MIHLTDLETKKETIINKASLYRRAASAINTIKPVIQAFDGKMYNKRFNEAISALNTPESKDHFHAYTQYRWFYIDFTPGCNYSDKKTLLHGYSCTGETVPEDYREEKNVIFDGKRINAEKMINSAERQREYLLKTAYELENAAADLETTLQRIADTEKLLMKLTHDLPSEVVDICNIKRYY